MDGKVYKVVSKHVDNFVSTVSNNKGVQKGIQAFENLKQFLSNGLKKIELAFEGFISRIKKLFSNMTYQLENV